MDGLVTDPESRTIRLPASGLFRTAVGAKRLLDQVSATGGQAPCGAPVGCGHACDAQLGVSGTPLHVLSGYEPAQGRSGCGMAQCGLVKPAFGIPCWAAVLPFADLRGSVGGISSAFLLGQIERFGVYRRQPPPYTPQGYTGDIALLN